MRSLFWVLITSAAFLAPQLTIADRSVSIVTSEGKLTLVNPSAATVTYTVECYDRVTGANIVTGAANVTLTSKADIDYESSGGCAGGLTPTYKSTQGVTACTGNVNFAGAAALCGAQSPICTHANLVSRGITSLQGYPHSYWFQASTDPWGYTYDNWSKGYPAATSGKGKFYQPRTYNDNKKNNADRRCHTANVQGSPGTGISYCYVGDTNTSSSGTLCCPTNNGFKSCKVTIHSATPTAGALQSPQFKGGASF